MWTNQVKMHLVFNIVLLLLSRTVSFYQWLEFNRDFDCTVGITVDNKPVSIGVFITDRSVITSANPLNQYLNNSERIKIHTISRSYKNSIQRKVESIAGNQSFRKQSWVPIGYNDTSHTTIHDIVLIIVVKSDAIPTHLYRLPEREPHPVSLPYDNSYLFSYDGWIFAGFGYIDQNHISDNNILEMSYFKGDLADCDEWIPREWGRFICILDDRDLAGLASGAPLFRSNNWRIVYGIGSFALKKDKNRILVFTDMRPYHNNLYGWI